MKRKHMLLLVLVLALTVIFFYQTSPQRHAERFVSMYADQIQRSIESGDGVPENLGCLDVNQWQGDQPMTEFLLSGWGIGSGKRYYGCYYSPNDVPLPFQNAPVPLIQSGDGCWKWQGDGDNQGITRKLRDGWYYFEASF